MPTCPALRPAEACDIDVMYAFILEHGPNPWNHLPPDEVARHLKQIAEQSVEGVLAMEGDRLVGFVTYTLTDAYAAYEPPGAAGPHGYVCEAVVHRDCAGKGVGTTLLGRALQRLRELGCRSVYIDRHEENSGSAGMMRKAGFVAVHTYHDPLRRPHGSRRTTLCRHTPA